jgi:hypothetical protein
MLVEDDSDDGFVGYEERKEVCTSIDVVPKQQIKEEQLLPGEQR